MAETIEFVEATEPPLCPHCEQPLAQVEFRKQKLAFSLLAGQEWILLLSCPHCRKVIGATNR